jgi:hypothetical protein
MSEIDILIVRIGNATVSAHLHRKERTVLSNLDDLLDLTACRKGYRNALLADVTLCCCCCCSHVQFL